MIGLHQLGSPVALFSAQAAFPTVSRLPSIVSLLVRSAALVAATSVLVSVPPLLTALRVMQIDRHDLPGAEGRKIWAMLRMYAAVAAAGYLIGALAVGVLTSSSILAAVVYGACCRSLIQDLAATSRQHAWAHPPPAGRPQQPRSADGHILPFPSQAPASMAKGWRRMPWVLQHDGGGPLDHPPTVEEAKRAASLLQVALVRFFGGPQTSQITDWSMAQAWLDRQESASVRPIATAWTALRSIHERPIEILSPLVDTARLVQDLERRGQEPGQSLTEDEKDRLLAGMILLREGLQACTGSWTAHLPVVADTLRGNQMSPRNWLLRALARQRFAVVEEFFRDRAQQVHHLNAMRHALWTHHQIALPGATHCSRDWHITETNPSERHELAWTLHLLQAPDGLAQSLRGELNTPFAEGMRQRMRAEIAQRLSQSAALAGGLRGECIRAVEQAESSAPLRCPFAQQRDLEGQIDEQNAAREQALPWAALLEDLLRAPEAQRAELRERLMRHPLLPALSEQLRPLLLSGSHWEEARPALERRLAHAEFSHPAFRRARLTRNRLAAELASLRSQLHLAQRLAERSPARPARRPEVASTSAQQTASRCFQRLTSLSEALNVIGLPSLWELLDQRFDELAPCLVLWLDPAAPRAQDLVDQLVRILATPRVEVRMREWFLNDQVTEAGAFEVLRHYGLIERLPARSISTSIHQRAAALSLAAT